MFAWWGLFTWMPPYLSLPVEQGGRGFGVMGTTTLMVVLNFVWNVSGIRQFGWVAEVILDGASPFLIYTFMASLLVALMPRCGSLGYCWWWNGGRFLRDRIFFWLWHHRQRDFSHPGSSPRFGFYL